VDEFYLADSWCNLRAPGETQAPQDDPIEPIDIITTDSEDPGGQNDPDDSGIKHSGSLIALSILLVTVL